MKTNRLTYSPAVALLTSILLLAGCTDHRGLAGLGQSPPPEWHIAVKRFRMPGHREAAEQLAKSFRRAKGIDTNKVHVYHDTDWSIIGYGAYTSAKDRQGLRDLEFIRTLGVPGQGLLFPGAHFEPIPEPDPPIESAWRLENAGAYWTLEVARFDRAGRKQAAAEYVKHLRSQGIPAYVSFGRMRSIVTIGAFPENAVRTVAGHRRNAPQRLVPVDPQLKKWKEQYPHLLINGQYHTFVVAGKQRHATKLATRIIHVRKATESFW